MNPNRDGWWIYNEECMEPQRVLIAGGIVASDDEWERATGRPPSDVYSENYWEGTDVEEMSKYGTWSPLPSGSAAER